MPESHYFSPTLAPHRPEVAKLRQFTLEVAQIRLQMRGGAGVFSKNELDDGTHLLIETFLTNDKNALRICDLGCGWGAVGCVVARARPNSLMYCCDINGRAVQFARYNARHNALDNILTWQGDGLSAIKSQQFDAVLCNPPVRAGNAVIGKLFDDSHRCLTSGGSLWIVLRTAQGAKSWAKKLENQFGNVSTLAIKNGFRILKCVR